MQKRILVIHGNEDIRELLYLVLEKDEGYYEVEMLSDGRIAFDVLTKRERTFAVILLGGLLGIEGMNGLALIKALKEQDERWLRSIIVLSASADAIEEAKALGIRSVLKKPFALVDLLDLIAATVS